MNEKIFYYLNNLLGESIIFDKVILFLSNNFGYLLMITSFLFLIFHHDAKKEYPNNKTRLRQKVKEIIILFGSTLFAWILVVIIKKLFINPRPFILYPDIKTLFIYGGEDSFPSGHAAFYGALAVSIFSYHKRAGFVFAIGAVLIGLARVIAGVHFPLDILMGFVFGASVSVLVYYFIRILAKKYKKYIDFLFNCV
jgi:undecaprenyl-diphosphatase